MDLRSAALVVAAACLVAFPVAAPAADPFDCAGIVPSSVTEVRAELVTGSLSEPVDVVAPPGDAARLFIVQQGGRIRILRLADDTLLAQDFLDISGLVDFGGEKGLLGLAFHPQYGQPESPDRGYFYLNYTRTTPGVGLETAIVRYTVSADPDIADADSAKVLLTFPQPFSNHNGGQMLFGPLDGYLYISTGDGGSGGDPNNNAQNPRSLLGKLLRLDVDSGDPYGIPESNPFAGSLSMANEIWALGLRNPWRVTFDPLNGDLYIADVGQGQWEEVAFDPAPGTPGLNYEWKVREGNHDFSASTPYGPGTRRGAVLEYPHVGTGMAGCSITGGKLYRGCAMPQLHGTYFFADYCNNWVRSFRIQDGQVAEVRDRTAELNLGLTGDVLDEITAFGMDGRGEVYICDKPSKLFRIVAAPGPTPGRFVRGDANADLVLDLSDAVSSLIYQFSGSQPTHPCRDALDSNDDGQVDVSDAVHGLEALFRGGPLPTAPYPACGTDASEDSLDCATGTCT